MKVLGVLIMCTIVASVKSGLSKEEKDKFKALIEACSTEVGATDADAEDMIKGIPASNMETKCLRACLMKKFNVINSDGKFDKEGSLKMAALHIKGDADKMKLAEEVANACADIDVPDDHCEAAELYKMCLVAQGKKHGFNPME